MRFLQQMDELYFHIAFLIIFIVGHFIVQQKNNLKLILQYRLYAYGIAILLLSMKIPHVFSGFPYEVSDLENKKMILYHLQRNNEALVKTTEAIREIILITFVFSFLIIGTIIKQYKIDKSAE